MYGNLGARFLLTFVFTSLAAAGCSNGRHVGASNGTITGVATACGGAPSMATAPVRVRVALERASEVIATQVVDAGGVYRFSEPPGKYLVRSDVPYVAGVAVTLASRQIVQANLGSSCG